MLSSSECFAAPPGAGSPFSLPVALLGQKWSKKELLKYFRIFAGLVCFWGGGVVQFAFRGLPGKGTESSIHFGRLCCISPLFSFSGHRLGTAEIESAINSHPDIIESAVVGVPHDIKGVGIYAFVTARDGVDYTEQLKKEICATVRRVSVALSAICMPHHERLSPPPQPLCHEQPVPSNGISVQVTHTHTHAHITKCA